MLLLFGILLLAVSRADTAKKEIVTGLPLRLPDTYKDIFASGNGRPTLGNTKATCWARGGICVDIKDCPGLVMDVGVPGCSWGFKVCCRMFKFGSPTVGIQRTSNYILVHSVQDLDDDALVQVASRNSLD